MKRFPFFLSQFSAQNFDSRGKVFATNYHGLARRILRLYGYLVADNLRHIDTFKSIDESNQQELSNLGVGLTYDETLVLSSVANSIKNRDLLTLNKLHDKYVSLVKANLIPNGYIPYNAILIFAKDLLQNNPCLLEGYKKNCFLI